MSGEPTQSLEGQPTTFPIERVTPMERKSRSRRALMKLRREEVRERDATIDVLTQQSEMDKLTGVRNLRGFYGRLAEDIERMGRTDEPLTFVMLDINGFKQENDLKGHVYGDASLIKVAKTVGDCIRLGDTIARIGGDEFGLLLPGIKNGDLFKIWERINEELTRNGISVGAGAVNLHPEDLGGPKKSRDMDVAAKEAYLVALKNKLVGRAHDPMYAAKFEARDPANPNFKKSVIHSELPV